MALRASNIVAAKADGWARRSWRGWSLWPCWRRHLNVVSSPTPVPEQQPQEPPAPPPYDPDPSLITELERGRDPSDMEKK
jgi:hypothetical protein